MSKLKLNLGLRESLLYPPYSLHGLSHTPTSPRCPGNPDITIRAHSEGQRLGADVGVVERWIRTQIQAWRVRGSVVLAGTSVNPSG